MMAGLEDASYATSCNSSLWRFGDVASLDAVRSAANVCGRLRAAREEAAGAGAPPRLLVGEGRVPESLRQGAPATCGVSTSDETLFKAWFERQIQALCGRHAAPETRLRRSDKVSATAVILFKRFFLSQSVIECDPMTFALCSIFLASKLEDEFIPLAALSAAVNEGKDEATKASMAAEVGAAEMTLLMGVNFDLRIAHPHRPLRALFARCAEGLAASPALDAQRAAALDGCDAALCTDAPLLHAPTVLAVAALSRSADASTPLSPSAIDGRLRALFEDGLLNVAYALATTLPAPGGGGEEDPTELKKVRKRLKKCALWASQGAPRKRPAADISGA